MPYHQRMAVCRNLIISFVKNEKVNTTLAKAKVLARSIEKVITIAKNSDKLETKRLLMSKLDKDSEVKLYEIAKRFSNRNGGYTRVIKTYRRYGDSAKTATVELVD